VNRLVIALGVAVGLLGFGGVASAQHWHGGHRHHGHHHHGHHHHGYYGGGSWGGHYHYRPGHYHYHSDPWGGHLHYHAPRVIYHRGPDYLPAPVYPSTWGYPGYGYGYRPGYSFGLSYVR
jgi:hypothetical protein